jgi:hypothetical protein
MSKPQITQSEAVAAFNFCSYWPGIKVGLSMAGGSITNPALKAAIAGLVSAADSYCGLSQFSQGGPAVDRAALARIILDKVGTDPAWKEQLISNPSKALQDSDLQPVLSAFGANNLVEPDCAFSCIIST